MASFSSKKRRLKTKGCIVQAKPVVEETIAMFLLQTMPKITLTADVPQVVKLIFPEVKNGFLVNLYNFDKQICCAGGKSTVFFKCSL